MSGTGRGHGDASELVAGPHRDSTLFTAVLWGVHLVVFGAGVAGLALKAFLPELAGVGTAGVILLWLVSGTAIVDRAKLRNRPSWAARVAALAASLVLVAAGVVVVALDFAAGPWLLAGAAARVGVAAGCVVVYAGWLVLAYRARMFRWRRPWVAPPR